MPRPASDGGAARRSMINVTDPTTAELLDTALHAAHLAGVLLCDGRPADPGVAATKSSPVDIVTEMDIAAVFPAVRRANAPDSSSQVSGAQARP